MDNDLLDGKNDFFIFSPGVEVIEKSDAVSRGVPLDQLRPIGGTCSTQNLDRQEEVVIAKGLDFTEFVKHGYFNDNHKQDTASVLGVPRFAELRKSRWYTEGNLLPDYEPADRIWSLAKSLAKSGLQRRLGFSIEGKVTDRDTSNRITRAIIRHVAITNSPVNTDCTWDILAKAFAPRDEVEATFFKRALTNGHPIAHQGRAALMSSVEAGDGTYRIERDTIASLDKATEVIKKHTGYSWGTCERLAKLITQQHRRN